MRLVDWKLHDIMERLGLDQTAAGRHYGVNQSTIGRWLNGGPIDKEDIRQRIETEYATIFGPDAAPENPLPASLTQRLAKLSDVKLRKVFDCLSSVISAVETD